MKGARLVIPALAALAFASGAAAGGIDGEQELVCDLVEAAQCDGDAACSRVTVEQIDLPPEVHVDFEARQVTQRGTERTSPIAAVEVLDAVVVVQGHQEGRGWTMVIERASGHLSATIADAAGAFVLAGACTAR